MQIISYVSDDFIREKSAQYTLSIRYSTDGLSFCVYNLFSYLLLFKHYPLQEDDEKSLFEKFKVIVDDEKLLLLPYFKVYFISYSERKMLLPAGTFSESTLDEVVRTCIPVNTDETITTHKLTELDTYIVEPIPNIIENFLKSSFTNVVILNSAHLFIKNAITNIDTEQTSVFIDIHNKHFDMFIVNKGGILLFNTFDYMANIDIVYYSLNSITTLGLSVDKVRIVLSGILVTDKNLLDLFTKYITLPIVMDNRQELLISKGIENCSPFTYFLKAHKCGL